MKILFICTAHNSLSQSLFLALSRSHEVSVEYATSNASTILAVALAGPDLIICPFLTTLIPAEIYENYLTLIIHPGPPEDVGPSALDWVLLGDDGSVDDADELLHKLDTAPCLPGRSHWGVTVLQATADFDAGPVWAFEQFPIDIDQPGLTKSVLYRGPVTQSAISATLAAISRIRMTPEYRPVGSCASTRAIPPHLQVDPSFARLSATDLRRFQGGKLHNRPLLKAAQRDFDLKRHTAQQVSRRVRCADSQPGVLSKVFGRSLYVYGGQVEDNDDKRAAASLTALSTSVLGIRKQAICLSTCDGKGVWITHVRKTKTKDDKALFPKVPAVSGLIDLGILNLQQVKDLQWSPPAEWALSKSKTFQEVWVEFDNDANFRRTAYLHFDFYNGAMATDQCIHLIEAMDYIIAQSTAANPIQAVVLMGGAYFSNGIALNVIESATDPAVESWMNINRIDDVVHYLLHEFPKREIFTIAAIRGNAAAGGVALAAACDIVIAGASTVLNPAYRAVGLYGSEYHSLSYFGRCGKVNATRLLRSMTPMSPLQAQALGLVDYVFPGTGEVLDDYIRSHIDYMLKPGILKRGMWKSNIDVSPLALAQARANELAEMSLDFWSARSQRYHSRRYDFVRKVKPTQTPLRFATHRRICNPGLSDEEETNDFDSVQSWQKRAEAELMASLRARIAAEMESQISKRREDALKNAAELIVLDAAPSKSVQEYRRPSTIFSCYYQPPGGDLLTPPESPMVPDDVVMDRFAALVV